MTSPPPAGQASLHLLDKLAKKERAKPPQPDRNEPHVKKALGHRHPQVA